MSGRPLPPRPAPDRDTQPFWDAAGRRRLVVPRCGACGAWIWQPRPLCPRCHAGDPKWTEVAGRGTVASWTVVHAPVLAAWADRVPFVVLLVALDEGPRMVGQLVDDDGDLARHDEGLRIGAPVVLRWRTEAGITLPCWARAG